MAVMAAAADPEGVVTIDFDEDAWDKQDAKTRRKRTAANQAQSTQPPSTPQMTAPTTNATE
ncbi:hypothetical protein FRC07_005906 [Ceratobasidium sp. 392]|nr:hypothetical protein FRC07_005906 [Ceratobasidium sp. 392]